TARAEKDIFEHRWHDELLFHALKHHAHTATDRSAVPGRAKPVHRDLAGSGHNEPVQTARKHRLARTVAPDDADSMLGQIQRDILKNGATVDPMRDAGQSQILRTPVIRRCSSAPGFASKKSS